MIDVLSFSWSLADKNVPHRKIPLCDCHVFTSTCFFCPPLSSSSSLGYGGDTGKAKLHMIDASQESMACTLRW